MPRPSLPALRRAGATALAVLGVSLVAASASGIARMDATLASATAEPTAPPTRDVRFEERSVRACPEPATVPQRDRSSAPALY